MQRPTAPDLYPELRAAYYGPSGKPPAAPQQGATSADVLAEFRERLAPYLYAAQHPGSYSYFTPPPLPIAIAAETLAAWTNQGIDLWLAGMAAPFVEEEVTRWLCDLTGLRRRLVGHPRVRRRHGERHGADRRARHPPREAPGTRRAARAAHSSRTRASTSRIRRTSRSRAAWTCWASRSRRSASCRRTTGTGCARTTVAAAIAEDRAAGLHAVLHRARRRLDQHGLDRPGGRARRPGRAGGALAPRGRGVRRRGAPLRAGRPPRDRPGRAPTPSRSTRTSGSSSRTTSARSW